MRRFDLAIKPQDRQGARPRRASDAAGARRRGDRIGRSLLRWFVAQVQIDSGAREPDGFGGPARDRRAAHRDEDPLVGRDT